MNNKGFVKQTYADLLDGLVAKAKELFGQDINTSSYTPLGILIRIMAFFYSILWDTLEYVYHNAFPGSASDNHLSKLVKFKGMERLPDEYSHGPLEIKGTPGAEIQAGLQATNGYEIIFETIEAVTLNAFGVGYAESYALDIGESSNVQENTLNQLVEAIEDVDSVNNPQKMVGGQDRETDFSLRKRFDQQVESGNSTAPSVEAKLLEVAGVRDAIVEENDTNETDMNGIPPHCIAPFVFGGEDAEVAKAIYEVKAGGVQSYGSIYVPIEDKKRKVHQIGFTRPVDVDIHIRVILATTGTFPTDGAELVRDNILAYIDSLGLGEKVVFAKVVSAALIQGVDDAAVTLSKDGITFSSGNVNLTREEVARTTPDKVVVN